MKKMEDVKEEDGGHEKKKEEKKREEMERKKRSKRGKRESTRMNLVLGRLGKGGGEGHQ